MQTIVIASDLWYSATEPAIWTDNIVGIHLNDYFQPADVLIIDTRPVSRDDLEQAPNLKGIVRIGVGYNNLPLDYCRERGIVLAYTPNAPSQSVAELALSFMLAALRSLNDSKRCIPGRMLHETDVAIIGRGRIGKRFAAMLSGLQCDIMAVDPVGDTTFDEIHKIQKVDLEAALKTADVVSLHVPLDYRTRNMIGAEELALMKLDGILINTARGGIVNETDLAQHLIKHPRFTACLDVFEREPYIGGLRGHKNCITSAHVGSMTRPARYAMETQAMEAALAILDGKRPQWVIPEKEPWQDEAKRA